MAQDLTQTAMLARLSISQWTARKFDKKATAKVAEEYNTTTDAGRYTKRLIAEEAIKAIKVIADEARTWHYTQTLPWKDDGYRILTAANFEEYSAQGRQRRAAFEAAVSQFVASYPAYVEAARQALNGLWKAEDYPAPADIVGRYSFEIQIEPLPAATDFRVQLQAADVDRLRAEIEARNQAATETAMRDLWGRVKDAVEHVVERLSDKENIFRDTLITNLRDLVDLLPRLNLTSDPALEAAREAIKAKLLIHSPEGLRSSSYQRSKATESAQQILDQMAANMAGFIGQVNTQAA